jgi:hypothetical protein
MVEMVPERFVPNLHRVLAESPAFDLLVLATTKLISNYTNHLAQTPNNSFMKLGTPGKLKAAV